VIYVQGFNLSPGWARMRGRRSDTPGDDLSFLSTGIIRCGSCEHDAVLCFGLLGIEIMRQGIER
jgi:hypothetical protein